MLVSLNKKEKVKSKKEIQPRKKELDEKKFYKKVIATKFVELIQLHVAVESKGISFL